MRTLLLVRPGTEDNVGEGVERVAPDCEPRYIRPVCVGIPVLHVGPQMETSRNEGSSDYPIPPLCSRAACASLRPSSPALGNTKIKPMLP
ncbi:hypothetical protein AAFF_G00122090 [Aldrovandia affinis]|uniref:Uncharacterized protein n=1 Tax=Aldrovandia affinis TaxID=143900 RepID=A0AAD7WAV5_9TELE|nr:hypothetical protein AAFF_G00122090 [Aldrovandia affinis]